MALLYHPQQHGRIQISLIHLVIQLIKFTIPLISSIMDQGLH